MTWENFTYEEFACRCGTCASENRMAEFVIDNLQELRTACGFPFVITSGYRCADHPIEAVKDEPGPHNTGLAVDIALTHKEALAVLSAALLTNAQVDMWIWQGFGLNQKGGERFVHLDQCEESGRRVRPHIWTY